MPVKRAKTAPQIEAAAASNALSSSVYKSLFDKPGNGLSANDGMGGQYEGDFMTRSAKFGLQ